jgi:hypothetical protein
MRRGFTAFLLMVCMFWQALAHAGIAVVIADHEEQDHAVMHFAGEAHHHDHHDDDGDDGNGVHQDRSQASAQHLVSDAAVFAPVLTGDFALKLPQLHPGAPVLTAATPPPPPFLDGPERPPKSLS